ncbi:MAG: DUF45 domain-containing protein [Abditibacteriota bacterium]|nr:DUF45 domain-containing protein [Abditibacteriota bacterium]
MNTSDTETIAAGGVTARVVRKPNKNVYIRIEDGSVVITAPFGAGEDQLREILSKHADMLKRRLGEKPAGGTFSDGSPVLYLGKEYIQKYTHSSYVWEARPEEEGILRIKCPVSWTEAERKAFFTSWFAERLAELLPELVAKWENLLDIRAEGGFYVDFWKTSWGKCNLKKRAVGFNAALAQAPVGVIEAVVLHELLHLRYPDHGKGFHDALEKYMPEAKESDRYLKRFYNVLK